MALDQPSWQASQTGGDLPEHSSGEPSTGVAAAKSGVSSAVRIHGNVLELAGRVQSYPTKGVAGFWLDRQLYFNTIRGSCGAEGTARPRMAEDHAGGWV